VLLIFVLRIFVLLILLLLILVLLFYDAYCDTAIRTSTTSTPMNNSTPISAAMMT